MWLKDPYKVNKIIFRIDLEIWKYNEILVEFLKVFAHQKAGEPIQAWPKRS